MLELKEEMIVHSPVGTMQDFEIRELGGLDGVVWGSMRLEEYETWTFAGWGVIRIHKRKYKSEVWTWEALTTIIEVLKVYVRTK